MSTQKVEASGNSKKKGKTSYVSQKKLETQNRETGMDTEISCSSKGFQLLQKMGYKPGAGIGKFGKYLSRLPRCPPLPFCGDLHVELCQLELRFQIGFSKLLVEW